MCLGIFLEDGPKTGIAKPVALALPFPCRTIFHKFFSRSKKKSLGSFWCADLILSAVSSLTLSASIPSRYCHSSSASNSLSGLTVTP
jgi:hypothetical protein